MPALEARLKDFSAAGAALLGISCDSVFCHEAWTRHLKLSYPLLSDIHRKTCEAYGVYNPVRACARRSIFILDKDGVIRFKEEYAPGQLPDPERLLQAVRGL